MNIQRDFIIGSEWLYYKIYSGPKTSDQLLIQVIKPTVSYLIKHNVIDKWFFIRYNDPNHHIRVRFHSTAPKNINTIITTLYEKMQFFITQGLVWKVQIDSYQREIERYGATTMEQAETLFFNDSSFIIRLLESIGEDDEARWLFGLKAIDLFLSDFQYTEDQKLHILDQLKTGFGLEFGMDRSLKKQLDKKYRTHKDKIKSILMPETSMGQENRLFHILEKRSQQNQIAVQKIQSLTHATLLNDKLSSYIHMTMNRLFRSNNRLHEMVIYGLLYRAYKEAWGIRNFKLKKIVHI